MYDKQYANEWVGSFFLFLDRSYTLSTRARKCESGCKSTLECIR